MLLLPHETEQRVLRILLNPRSSAGSTDGLSSATLELFGPAFRAFVPAPGPYPELEPLANHPAIVLMTPELKVHTDAPVSVALLTSLFACSAN